MAAMASLLIDGSFCEGGGQLLRNSVALSALLSKPISIHNVRENRSPPGLRKQHEAGINLAAEICSANVTGDLKADPGTAGSTTLLLQVSLPCLLFSGTATGPSTLILRGGTNASHAPQIDYTEHIFLPFLRRRFGLYVDLKVQKRGYYPKGGGSVLCTIHSRRGPLQAISLTERGPVISIKGQARVGGLSYRLADRIRAAARAMLISGGIRPSTIAIESVKENAAEITGAGAGIVLWAETENGCILGGSSISVKGKEPESVGEEAAKELLNNLGHGGCVDEYMQDQMIIFLALAKGRSTIRAGPVTMHTRTAVWVAEQLTSARFQVEELSPEETVISCEGIGFEPNTRSDELLPPSSMGA